MTKPKRQRLSDLRRIEAGHPGGRQARFHAQLRSHLNELTLAVAREDWVYAHRVASALTRLSGVAGDLETQSSAESVCRIIERSGDRGRIHNAVQRLCRPFALAMDKEFRPAPAQSGDDSTLA